MKAKRIIAVLLCLSISLSAVPLQVFAAETTGKTIDAESKPTNAHRRRRRAMYEQVWHFDIKCPLLERTPPPLKKFVPTWDKFRTKRKEQFYCVKLPRADR